MSRSAWRTILLAGTALGSIAVGSMSAQAGGFALREQGAYYQGTSFAGVAAGGGPSISSMFWNPATLTQAPLGVTLENSVTGIFGNSVITPTTATHPAYPGLFGFGGSGNIAEKAGVPSGYLSINPGGNWAFGVALGAPFGLVTNPRRDWAGMFYSRESEVVTYNVTPMAAYRVNDWLSVGAGVQVQYMRVRLDQAFPLSGTLTPPDADTLSLKADGVDVGFTAGITLTPTPWTTIGIGYRSAINQTIDGPANRPAFLAPNPLREPAFIPFPAAGAGLHTTIPLPDTVSLGIRQKVTEQFTLLGTAEWTNWSRFGDIPVQLLPNNPPPPGIPAGLPFGWEDGWFASFGAEYAFTPAFAVRAGVGFEQSPITDAVRSTRLPDNDRVWVSGGFSWAYSERLTFDFGYTHIFVEDAPINLTAASGNPTFNPALGSFTGVGRTDVDIVSLGLRFKFTPPPQRLAQR